MARGNGLERRTPMPRRAARLEPVSPLKPGGSLPRIPRRARKDTGPSRAVRRLVLARDRFCCAGCGKNVAGGEWSVQHRVARGMGGTSRADVNSPVNLVLLCGSATSPGGCHLACERRDPVMHERGLWLSSWEDPALVPVVIAVPGGLAVAWPWADGTYSVTGPEGAEAA